MSPHLKLEWCEKGKEGSLLALHYTSGTSEPLPHVLPLKERSESKRLRHSIQFQLCFYLICSSLCLSWKGGCNLKSKFLSKKRCPGGRQAVCLSSTRLGGHTVPRSGTRATLYVHTFYWNFTKQERLAEKKTIAVTSK